MRAALASLDIHVLRPQYRQMPSLQVGDVVRLKSGGPRMTVFAVTKGADAIEMAVVAFFGANEKLQSEHVPSDALSDALVPWSADD